jgi:uncharacterized protein YecE (DUF72 family)
LFRDDRIEEFFQNLPRTVEEAARLSTSADRHPLEYPREISTDRTPLRYSMEVRHHSFENPDFIDLLRRHGIALVFADTAGKWPYMEDLTSDFLYLRLHGDQVIYTSGYDEAALQFWARRIRLWQKGLQPADALTMSEKKLPPGKKDVYVYFDNDVKVRAPFDAIRLHEILAGNQATAYRRTA